MALIEFKKVIIAAQDEFSKREEYEEAKGNSSVVVLHNALGFFGRLRAEGAGRKSG